VSYERAQAEVKAIMDRLATDHRDERRPRGARDRDEQAEHRYHRTGADRVDGLGRRHLFLVCANIAVPAARPRHHARASWPSARRSAPVTPIVRQLLTESLLLAFTGTATGLVAAFWALRALQANLPDWSGPRCACSFDCRQSDPGVHNGLMVLCTVLFGMAPALRAGRLDLNDSLKQGSRGTGGPGRTSSASLIVGEVAVLVMLVASKAARAQLPLQLQRVDLGFTPDQVATMTVHLPDYRYPDFASYASSVDGRSPCAAVPIALGAPSMLRSIYNGDSHYTIDSDRRRPVGTVPTGGGRAVSLRSGFRWAPNAASIRATATRPRWSRSTARWPPGLRRSQSVGRRISSAAATRRGAIIGVVGDVRHSDR
jgi:hypothetical protein